MVRIKRTSEKSIIPRKGSSLAAGYDLFSIDEPTVLQHSERKLFKTGIHIQLPAGYYGRIAPRSGLALKQGIDVLAGVIDADYTGEVGVILINLNNTPVTVDTSKAIAQLIIEECHDMRFMEVSDLNETDRNSGGFGSTDSKSDTIVESIDHPSVFKKDRLDKVQEGQKHNPGKTLIEIFTDSVKPSTSTIPYSEQIKQKENTL